MGLTELLGLGATAASGGLFGVLGAAFGGWMKLKERKNIAVEKIAERAHELKLIEMNMQVRSQEGSWDALRVTHQSEVAVNGQENYKWVIAMKSLFRPFLTLVLWVLVALQLSIILTGNMQEYLKLAGDGTILSREELLSLIRYIVYSTVFSATTATTWWFGERALSLPEMKNR